MLDSYTCHAYTIVISVNITNMVITKSNVYSGMWVAKYKGTYAHGYTVSQAVVNLLALTHNFK